MNKGTAVNHAILSQYLYFSKYFFYKYESCVLLNLELSIEIKMKVFGGTTLYNNNKIYERLALEAII